MRDDVETVDELTPDMDGVWLVTTKGSTHIWDMDACTYKRMPGKQSSAGAFEFDGEPQPITRVDRYPKVGSFSRVWFGDPERHELFRQSSEITRIERVR